MLLKYKNRLTKFLLLSLICLSFITSVKSAEDLSEAKINEYIYQYIMENPEVILESVDRLRKKMEENTESYDKFLEENFTQMANNPLIPFMGSDNPKVTIIEFFDYNCGYCKKSLDAIRELLRSEYDLKISFRDYPILSPSSKIAAAAALAAKEQGKYFLFHSALMSLQGNLDESKIYSTAENLEIDIVKLKEDMNKPEIKKILEENEDLARKLNIRGTPTFLINGKLYAGALELNKLKTIINQSLEDS